MSFLSKFKLIQNLFEAYLFLSKNLIYSKKMICFDIYELGYKEHIIEYIKIAENIKGVSIFITTQDSNLQKKEILTTGHKLISNRILRYLYGIDLFITPQVHQKKPPKSYSIHIFHNQPIKYISFPKNLLVDIDEHFVWSPLMEKWIENMLENHCLNSKITRIGNPRLDRELFSCKIKKKKLNDYSNSEKVFRIGYAPSWDPYLSLRNDGLNIIKEISCFEKSKIFVRLHPCSLVDKNNENFYLYTGGINWKKKILGLNLSNVFFMNEISTIDYLKNIDVLITDVSSISHESLLMDIPVIFYETPKYWDPNFNQLYKEYCFQTMSKEEPKNNILINGGRSFGFKADSLKNLIKFLKFIKNGDDPYIKSRKAFSKKLIFNKSNSKKFIEARLSKILKIKNLD